MVGPAFPLSPLGPPEKLHANVEVQHFEDGRLYHLTVTRGDHLAVLNDATVVIPTRDYMKAVWSTVHSPWDIGETKDQNLYMTLWAANE